MNHLANYCRELTSAAARGWNQFWFTPRDTATLGLIRILAGLMLLYTHLVWTLELESFFGRDGWLTVAAVKSFQQGPDTPSEPVNTDEEAGQGEARDPRVERSYAWSYFKWIDSTAVLWAVHIAGLLVFAMLVLGLYSRVVAILAFLITVSYANRVPGALFGLDDINAMLAMYLMVGPSGAAYSLDRWLAKRRMGGRAETVEPRVGANVAIRLIQIHMCVIYLFAALGKLQGVTWWEGTALWLAFANQEYQTLDMTWLADWPLIVNVLTHVTVFWELAFCALIWPRLTRPLMLALAIPLHLGIGICLGMMTFGLVMLIGCLAFVSPAIVRATIDSLIFRNRRADAVDQAVVTPAIRQTRQKPSAKRARKLS